MSAIDTSQPPHHFDHHHHHRRRLSPKRKLEDYDHSPADDDDTDSSSVASLLTFTRLRSNNSFNSKPKSIIDHHSTTSTTTTTSRLPLQFFVRKICDGETLVVQADLNDTVEMVLKFVESRTKIPARHLRVIYRGKQLQTEQTLEECRIQNDTTLEVVSRMRSTYHPQAWRVITDMVSVICRICRNEIPNFSAGLVKGKLEQYMALPLHKPSNNYDYNNNLVYRNSRKKSSKKKKQLLGVDDDDDDDEGEDDAIDGGENISKIDYCKIFMDACAPHALVMLYVCDDKRSQECANDCIRCFLGFVKDLEGKSIERAYCVTIVLEFCRLLSKMASTDNLLFLHCRSVLASMLQKIELASGPSEIYGSSSNDITCVTIQDVFPFFKELANRLVKGLASRQGPLPSDAIDFSLFLQPVLAFFHRRNKIMTPAHKSKKRLDHVGEEAGDLFHLFSELFSSIDACLEKIDRALSKKSIMDLELGHLGWSENLAILKDLNSISVLYAGFEDQFWSMMIKYKVAVCGLVVRYAKRSDDYSWLLKHKDILNFASRRHLAMLMFPEMREDYEELLEMLIDRSKLLAESFEYISRAQSSSLHAGLFMEFKNEEATGPGVLREWFCLVCQAIFDPQNALFVACPLDRRRFFPNPVSKIDPLHIQYFRFSGRIIALALMHKIQVGVVLDRIFFLQLAGRQVSLEDIQDADPCIYNSCKQILEMDAEFVDSDGLGLTFVTEVEELGSRKVVELCVGGKEIVVNSKNRKEYVNLIVQHHFVKSIADQVSSFACGFSDILRDIDLRETFFRSLELEDFDWMLYGSGSEICVEDWKAHTDYHGYKKSDPQIVWFWKVVGQLSAEQRRTLIFFWTSLKYLPVEGFRGLASRLYIYKSMESVDCLPSSHTCFYRLCIPPYPSKAVMQDRLKVITQEHVGCSFGTW